MADRENVIKGLECHLARMTDGMINGALHSCLNCPFKAEMNCSIQLIANALELLKEQDAVEPICISKSEVIHVYKCGNCRMPLVGKVRYCYECGRKVKWNETN